jgi:outer membrane immunogenic protein
VINRNQTERILVKTWAAVCSLVTLFLPASAETEDWAGGYAGIYTGGAFASGQVLTRVNPSLNTYFVPSSIDSIKSNGTSRFSPSKATGGIVVGYNIPGGTLWNMDTVAGIEADAGALTLTGRNSKTVTYPCCAPDSYHMEQSIATNGLYTLRGRWGVTTDQWFVYATGGLAATRMRVHGELSDSFGLEDVTKQLRSNFKLGWTAGTGVEWRYDAHWSIRGEYMFVDFGKLTQAGLDQFNDLPFGFEIAQVNHTGSMSANVVRVGINYRL